MAKIIEKPFDVAEWGDKPDPWPDGLFRSREEFAEAREAAEDLPTPELDKLD